MKISKLILDFLKFRLKGIKEVSFLFNEDYPPIDTCCYTIDKYNSKKSVILSGWGYKPSKRI